MVRVRPSSGPRIRRRDHARAAARPRASTTGSRWSTATARPGSPAVGAESLGRDPAIEAIFDEAREEATDRLIAVLGLGPVGRGRARAARDPPRLRRHGRGGDPQWLEHERLTRRQVSAFLTASLPRPDQRRPTRPSTTRTNQRSSSMAANANRTYVIGVGMTKFDKPGTKEGDYPDWAKEAGEKALADAGIAYERRRAGLRRLLLRRLDLRTARRLPARADRNPGRQRQQQLLDRLLGAVPGAPGGQGRPRRLRARDRLREDGEGLAGDEVHRPHQRRWTSTWRRMFEVREPEESPFAPQMFGNAGRDHMDKLRLEAPTTSRGSAGRTTSTRSTTPTRSSRTSTRSTTSRRRG